MFKAAFLKTILLCSMFIHTSSQVRGGVRKAEPSAKALRMKMEIAKANAAGYLEKYESSMHSRNDKLMQRLDEVKVNRSGGALQKVKKNNRKRANKKRKLQEEKDYVEFVGVSLSDLFFKNYMHAFDFAKHFNDYISQTK